MAGGLAPIQVRLLDFSRQLRGHAGVAREQQIGGPDRLTHPSRGVESWSNREADVVEVQPIAPQAGSLQQRREARPRPDAELLQP